MKVLLVRNYKYDGSMSMQVWANTLERELRLAGMDVRSIEPPAWFGQLKPSAHGVGKWLGYIDRFLIFPLILRRAAKKADVVHICDHGYAMFSACTGATPTIVTCHDLLAVRGAMGEETDSPASRFGCFLQKAIVSGLERATRVACVSEYTYKDAQRILHKKEHLHVVLNGLNYKFQRLDPAEAERRLAKLPGAQGRFVFHIGSNLPRKNREGVLRVFAQAAMQTDLTMLFSGAALSEPLTEQARKLGIAERIVNVHRPDVQTIEALYNRAVVLLFPSRYEGFGWPPIEAQACGCPVVASNIAPVTEVLGDSAVLKPLEDEDGMAGAVVRLATDETYRKQLCERGYKNVQGRFGMSRMIGDYVSIYREIACPGSN